MLGRSEYSAMSYVTPSNTCSHPNEQLAERALIHIHPYSRLAIVPTRCQLQLRRGQNITVTTPWAATQQCAADIGNGSARLSGLTPLKLLTISIVDEAFKTASVNEVDALPYSNKCVERLIRGKLFSASTIGDYKGWKSVRKYVDLDVKLHHETLDTVCIPAPQLVSMINPLFFRLSGRHDISQWLPMAIKVYRRLRGDAFIIENDGSLGEPQIRKKTINKNEVWIMNEDVAMSGLNDSFMSESGDSNSSELVTLKITTTRAEAAQKAGDLLQTLYQPDVDQAPLKPQLDRWLSESHNRVIPRETENRLRKIEGDVARIVIAVEQITTSCHNSKADVTGWPRHLAGANLTAEEMQELEARHMAELED
ncbi:hypothetical protein FGLOB1_5841 [Fusarium globosum]|uniref:Uncharacterized protein n=1 Tax=Fusarium globosum TaxID=78864 RepID=A0A8H6DAJ3_9HYPO|nr:hypothetical protein FGLOB1_5841 [Fusarium globosum]